MSYHPSSLPAQTRTSGRAVLRVLGALLSLVSVLLAALGIFFHQNVPGLIFAGIVALFGLRVFVLWLRAGPIVEAERFKRAPLRSGQAQDLPLQAVGAKDLNALHSVPLRPLQVFHTPRAGAGPVPTEFASAPTEVYGAPIPSYSQNQEAAYPPGVAYFNQAQRDTCPPDRVPTRGPTPPYSTPAPTRLQADGQMQQHPRYEERQAQIPAASSPYIPIEQDAMFELDRPVGNVQCLILPKEGEPLIECQDSYALNAERHCYAVADGVAGSFVPGPWARIVAKSFVERGGNFANKDDFQAWLVECSQCWHTWIENRWLPTMNALRERSGDRHGNWSDDIRQGAQTTLIGCSLLSYAEQQNTSNVVSVFAIGDGEFFLFSPNTKNGWELVETFPYTDPGEFGSRPDTLVTVQRADLLERAWIQRRTKRFNVFTGDIIVLASDTLAKWLLTEIQQQTDRWMPFLTGIASAEFEQRIRQEFHQGRIEDDDLTMLVIPVQ